VWYIQVIPYLVGQLDRLRLGYIQKSSKPEGAWSQLGQQESFAAMDTNTIHLVKNPKTVKDQRLNRHTGKWSYLLSYL